MSLNEWIIKFNRCHIYFFFLSVSFVFDSVVHQNIICICRHIGCGGQMCTWQNEAAALPPAAAAVSDVACRASRWMATLCEEREPIGTTAGWENKQIKTDEIKTARKTTGGGIQVRNTSACKLEFELVLFLRAWAPSKGSSPRRQAHRWQPIESCKISLDPL